MPDYGARRDASGKNAIEKGYQGDVVIEVSLGKIYYYRMVGSGPFCTTAGDYSPGDTKKRIF